MFVYSGLGGARTEPPNGLLRGYFTAFFVLLFVAASKQQLVARKSDDVQLRK